MKKHVFVLLILAVSAHCLPERMLLSSGYCFKEERYLTTQEKFDIVVTKIINEESWRLPYTINEFGGKVFPEGANYRIRWGRRYSGMIKTYKYSSLEEFYAVNPNSCELVETMQGGPYERLWVAIPPKERKNGRLNILVRVFYIYDYDTQNDDLPLYAERYFGLSNCGDLWAPEEVARLWD